MNTIENLNTALTITYNTESSYAIVFGANSGNTSSNVDPFGNTALTKQCSMTSVTSAVRDIQVDVTCDEVGAINLAYNNSCTAISVSQISSAGWRINGIRTVAQYDEAFANTRFTDLLGTVEDSTEYRLTTVVNDQKGNTQTWSTAVEVLDLPSLSMTGAVIYDEDVQANVTQVAIPTPAAGSTATFKITANTIPTYGSLSNATSSGNSVSITGTRAALITAIAAGNIKFLPASDYVSNVANAIQLSITNANLVTVVSTVNANIQVANTHAEYSFAAGTYNEDTLTSFGNIITDQDTHATSYTVTLQQTAGTAGVFYRSNVAVAGNANTLLSISNSKANINSTVSWLPATDSVGNVTFTYNQTQVTAAGNTVQAANITAVYSVNSTNAEIANLIGRTYTTNTVTQLFSASTPAIADGTDVGQSYTYTLSSNIGKFGNSAAYFSGNIGNIANTYSFTGNTTLTNADFANIRFAPLSRSTAANSVFTYTQSRNGVSQVNTTANLTANVQAFTPVTYTYTANTTFTPTFEQSNYGLANVLLVGGGGGAAFGRLKTTGSPTFDNSGGGGGGGGIYKESAVTLSTNQYTITIGAGGSGVNGTPTANVGSGNAGNGGNTSMTSSAQSFSTATGGEGGIFYASGITVHSARGGQGGGTGGGLGGDQTGNPDNYGLAGTANTGGGGGGGGNHYTGQAGGAGQTDATLGTAVFAGGGGSRRISSSAVDGSPGGNSYGQGGSGVTGGTPVAQDGTAGVITVNIS